MPQSNDVAKEKALALLWSDECETLTNDEFEVLLALATEDEPEELPLEELRKRWRAVLNRESGQNE